MLEFEKGVLDSGGFGTIYLCKLGSISCVAKGKSLFVIFIFIHYSFLFYFILKNSSKSEG